jgi:alpha-glucosidase
MAAGPMDFTPGSMINTNKENYFECFTRPMSMGTRAHQVAMYVVFEAPLQMMCESPTIYYKEQESVDFITQIPTVWDETLVLEALVSDYIVVARRRDKNWYIGAMTDWTERDFLLDFSFLGEGKFQMQSMRDGVNAARNAQDYKIDTIMVNQDSTIPINLSSGGGWVAIINRL